MPLTDRPKAPKRLPSADLENSFFRAWALRGSEGANATERSQGGSGASTPPSPISPFTQLPDRRVRGAERKKMYSESNVPCPSPILRGPPPPFESSCSPPITIHEEPPFSLKRASTAISQSGGSSLRSSVGSKARRVLGFPDARTSPNVSRDGRAPRKAQQGFTWSRATSGYCFEVRIARKETVGTPQVSPEGAAPFARAHTIGHSTEFNDRNSILMVEAPSPSTPRPLVNVDNSSRRAISPTLTATSSDPFLPSESRREGLYCRTKRALGLKNGPIVAIARYAPVPERAMTGGVGFLLDRTSSTLRYLPSKDRGPTTSSATPSNLSIASPRSANRWRHLRPGFTSSIKSSSSSIRSYIRGKPPPPTPEPQSMYTGSDNIQYSAVELTYPDGPNFLPSEARRLKTPPTRTPSVSGKTMLRGLYSEHYLPCDTEAIKSPSSGSTLLLPLNNDSRATSVNIPPTQISERERQKSATDLHRRLSKADWYRVEMRAIDGPGGLTREQFVLSVPEHLPNSPMCPKHPKNKSGGKGVCVYHGRNTT